jgi:hypothetical protein
MLIVSATWELEAGGSFEPRSSRLAWGTYQDPVSKNINKRNPKETCILPA